MHPVLVLHLRGTQAQMGAQHGRLLREAGGWEAPLSHLPHMPANLIFSSTRATWAERMLVGAMGPAFDLALSRLEAHRPPELRERARAFAHALGAHQRSVRYLGVMDLFQNAVGLLARAGLVPFAQRLAGALPPACTSFAVWGSATTDGRLLHGRNFDFPAIGVWERAPALVFCTPDSGLRYAFATTRGADVPGVTCLNEAGLTITAHTRFHRDVDFHHPAVIDFGHTLVRRASTLDEAIAVARELRSASSWAFFVSSAAEKAAVVIETTASGVEVTRVSPEREWLATTNRFHHPALQVDEVAPSAAFLINCAGRQARVDALCASARGWGPLDVQAVLGDDVDPETGASRPGGGVISQAMTVQSIVADHEGGVLHLSAGPVPTGRSAFAPIPLSWDAPVGYAEVRPEVAAAAPRDPGYPAFVEANRLQQEGGSRREVGAALEQAAAASPAEPHYRFLAGCYQASVGNHDTALDHFHAGLAHEGNAFHRGQLLLWGARVAEAAGQETLATRWRDALLETPHPLLAAHHAAAHRERRRGYAARRLRELPLHVSLVDAG